MAVGDPSSSVVLDSDPREYRPPPPHEFKPVGLKLYKPKRNTFDRGLVLQEPEVNWDLWAMIDPVVHADLLRSRQATGQRILLEGPFCRQWYLGERVVRQSLGYNVFRVPKPIPFSMLNAKHLTMEDVEKWTKGEDAATFLEGGDYEEYRVKRLMPIFSAHPPSQRPQARAVPTATGGEGAEVLGGASLEEVPQLPEQVIYCSCRGQLRSVDIPSPENVELALAPSVQQVSREYVESCFRCLSGMSALVRQKFMEDERQSMVIEDLEARLRSQSMVIEDLEARLRNQLMVTEDLEARLRVTQDQRVVSAGHSASAPQADHLHHYQICISGEVANEIAHFIRSYINALLSTSTGIALGKDTRMFFKVVAYLCLLSDVGSSLVSLPWVTAALFHSAIASHNSVSSCIVLAWSIWKSRNEWAINSTPVNSKETILRGSLTWVEFHNASSTSAGLERGNVPSFSIEHWSSPNPGTMKVNFDVAVKPGVAKAQIAVVLRDRRGRTLDGRSTTVFASSVLQGEALAVRLAGYLLESNYLSNGRSQQSCESAMLN
ncbi:hypothetical protein RHSIM_Rhsim12G0012200 [Rhododendron simsii]|uniref:Reticulon domain-containing protein n=1 Tax=Rhododendron simsii TaxID=118357 RepID=A0A834L9W8_RHOSS|nr:hypothetical protein RHSIM_Rhsim12G0012200 [Rhododendron simsii]